MGQFSMEISCATGSVLSGNQHASRITLNLDVDEEGHPSNADTCNEIINALNDHVIQVTENG
jgi:hypothetical protein